MERVKIDDGTTWPNPSDEDFHDIAWRLIHAQNCITKSDLMSAASVMEAYKDLITHPAFTLKVVTEKVSGIRKAIK